MHNWGKSIMECVKSKIDAMGMDNLDTENIEELKAWVCIAKDIAEYDYYYHITEAMEKPENEYGKNYDENGKYYSRMRDNNGRYMSRRHYNEYDPSDEYYRDMDMEHGKMYYTEPSMNMNSMNMDGNGGRYDSRYDSAKRHYTETKEKTPTDENKNMDAISTIFEVISGDMKELKPKMSSNEKMFARNKLNEMANSLV